MATQTSSAPSATETARFSIDVSSRLDQLARELIEAGRMSDRSRFDRLYSVAFGIAYGAAWRMTGDADEAQKLAARCLVRALRAGLEGSLEAVPSGGVRAAAG